jgi:hypothetical protein
MLRPAAQAARERIALGFLKAFGLEHGMWRAAYWLMAAGAAACLAAGAPAEAREQGSGETVDEAICRLIETSAEARALPVGFLTRLIWRESSFRLDVVSHAGAQGIAQFMPGTARERGLADPFDPEAAIPASAALLADLRRQFGNLGLAAAAYNAGPERVRQWLAGRSGLPAETVAYVARITGRPAEDWAEDARKGHAGPPADRERCLSTLALFRQPGGEEYSRRGNGVGPAPLAPWGVQVAGNFSKAVALAGYERVRARHASILGDVRPMVIGTRIRSRGRKPFYRIRLPAETRQAANALCDRLRAAQASCIVLKS